MPNTEELAGPGEGCGATTTTPAACGAGSGAVETPSVPSKPVGRGARRIAICGTAPSTRDQVPFGEQGFEFWSLNDAWQLYPTLKGETTLGYPRMVWFELHPREWFTGPSRPAGHLAWLQKLEIPVYMWEQHEDIPASVRYPVEEMCARFPGASARWDLVANPQNGKLEPKLSPQHGYLTSGIAYMAALAISLLRSGDELWFWGVDLAADTEYYRQRPCFEYLLGYAQGIGIKVALPSACPVLQGPAYGREDPKDATVATMRQRIEMSWQRAAMEKRQAEARTLVLQGKTQAYEELRALWPER